MSVMAERLTADEAVEIVDVLVESFADYPVMRYVLGPRGPSTDARLRRMIDFFVFRRARQRGPLLGVRTDGQLVAAAIMTLPAEGDIADDVALRREAMWADVGPDARARHEHYGTVTKVFASDRPHHHLNMIGVRPDWQGRRIARPLLDAVADVARADPASAGVSLTTELRRNVEMYERLGYRVIGRADVAPDLQTWGMFLNLRP